MKYGPKKYMNIAQCVYSKWTSVHNLNKIGSMEVGQKNIVRFDPDKQQTKLNNNCNNKILKASY